MDTEIKEKMDRHNYLLNKLKKLVELDESNLTNEEKEKIKFRKTQICDEIAKIRKELKINTGTVISENDLSQF